MNKMITDLLNRQGNERKEMATVVLSNTRDMLVALGQEDMLTANTSSIDVSKYELTIKELRAQLEEAKNSVREVEIIKEVPVVKEVEVIKEVPVEIIKEVTVSSKEDRDMIATLKAKVSELEAKVKDKDTLIATLIAKANTPAVSQDTSKNTNDTIIAPVAIDINDDMKILKNAKTWVFGTYKGVPFQASKKIAGTVIFDTDNYALKDEVEKVLLENKLIEEYRESKDPVRIENELGVCHKIDAYTYIGFVRTGTMYHCYAWRTNKEQSPATMILSKRLKNANLKYDKCNSNSVSNKIRKMIEDHKKAQSEYNAEIAKANTNVTVDTEKIAQEHRARLAALKIGGTTFAANTTNTATAVNTEEHNADFTTFQGLKFSFGDE